jgi:hypothetical protein
LYVVNWFDLAQDRDQWRALLNTEMNPSNSIKYWEVLEQLLTGGCSRRAQLYEVTRGS